MCGLVACGPADVASDPAARRAAPLPFDESPLLLPGPDLSPSNLTQIIDVNADGWLDVVGASGSHLAVHLGGPGGFDGGTLIETPFGAVSMAADYAHIDDGAAVVAIGNPDMNNGDGAVRFYVGSPTGLQFHWEVGGTHGDNTQPGAFGRHLVAPGDLSGDGIPDFLTVNVGRQMVFLMLVQPSVASLPWSAFAAINVGPVDGGFSLGQYAYSYTPPYVGYKISVYRTFGEAPAVFTTSAFPFRSHDFGADGVGDVDGDGREDLVTRHAYPDETPGPGWARLHLGVDGGGFSSTYQDLPVDATYLPLGFVGGDFDGDGFGDIVGSARVHRGGVGGVVESWSGNEALPGDVGDLDRDGYPDLVFATGHVEYGTPFGAPRGASPQVDATVGAPDADGAQPEAPATSWAGHSVEGSTALSADARLFLDSACGTMVAGLAPSTPDFGGQVVVYLDATAGGFADTAGFTDTADALRSAASGTDGVDRADVTFPEGFTADHALVFTRDDAALYALVEGGSHASLALSVASGVVVEASFSLADLGWDESTPIGFVGSHVDVEGAGRTDGIVGVSRFLAESPGWGPVTMPTSSTFLPYLITWSDGDDALTVDEGGTGTLDVLADDVASAGLEPATLAFATPSHGTAEVASGALEYTHDGSETTSDEVTYTVEDACGVRTGVVAVTVIPVDDVPTWWTGDSAVIEETPTALDVALVDADRSPDTPATVDLSVSHGTLTGAEAATVTAGAWGTAHVALSGTQALLDADLAALTYTPDAEYVGADTLALGWDDGAQQANAEMTLTVTAVDDPPVTSGTLALTVDRGRDAVIDADVVDATDVDSPSLTFVVSAPEHGAIVLGDAEVTQFRSEDLGTVAYRHDGSLTGSDTFQITVSDGTTALAPVSIAVTVTLRGAGESDPSCGCATGSGGAAPWGLLALAAVAGARRRARGAHPPARRGVPA